MKLFGLTGGIGMGKSAAAAILSRFGMPVIDTDEIAHQIVEPGQPALAETVAVFGNKIVDAEGKLIRSALAEIVFSSAEKLKQLESILHPRIRERWMKQSDEWRGAGRVAGVVVIPLLFETGAEGQFDAVVCCACSTATQRERLRARGWTDEQIERRLAAQWPVEKKIAASNYVIWTEGDMAVHERQHQRLFSAYFDSSR